MTLATNFPESPRRELSLEEWEILLGASRAKRSKDRTEAKIESMRLRPPAANRLVATESGSHRLSAEYAAVQALRHS